MVCTCAYKLSRVSAATAIEATDRLSPAGAAAASPVRAARVKKVIFIVQDLWAVGGVDDSAFGLEYVDLGWK